MIYVSLKGRLCNQMFQIAAATALSIDNNTNFICSTEVAGIRPTPEEIRIHRDTILKKIKFSNSIPRSTFIHQEPADFSYKKIEFKDNMSLGGYYQSEKYFKHRKEEIKKTFECPENVSVYMNNKFSTILEREDTCSVHVRRGDYLKFKDFHHNLPKDYYERCFKAREGSHFVFFSDDIKWCKETFKGLNSTFIDTGVDVFDFYLMSMMKDNIIANSSFSWWSAWMNNNEEKRIIAPNRWMGVKNSNLITKDLTPQEWTLIDA